MGGRAFTIAAPLLLCGGRLVGPGALAVADGRIARVLESVPARPDVDLPSGVLTPGLIDIQNNGAFGVDFATARGEDWPVVLGRLARHGVTALLPTIITAPLPAIFAAMTGLADAEAAAGQRQAGEARIGEARILGVHLEGPFIAKARKGAHCAEWICDPEPAEIESLLAHAPTRRMLRIITLAPERSKARAAIVRFAEAGVVVSLGHSDASAEDTLAAADAGATMVTHLFNAMRPFGHRDPALPGVALTDSRLFVGLIVDGHHVDPIGCRLAFQAAGGRVIAVSDSIVIAGLEAGAERRFGGGAVTLSADGVGRRPDGGIAGAGIILDEGIRRMIAAGVDPAMVLTSATEIPARALGLTDLGQLHPRAHADFVWWDPAWQPRRVWIGGEELELAQ